jgi:RNA polymerase sigma-70 factor (ECF subfamily)
LSTGVSLDRVLALGRAAHPGVEVPREALERWLGDRPEAEETALERAADIYLACACCEQIAGAASLFERRFLSRVAAYLGGIPPDPDFVAEVRQRLRIRFLVADRGQPARITRWRGAGSLASWVRVSASRMALDELRSSGRRARRASAALEEGLVAEDGELAYVKQRYRAPFNDAFAAALGGLRRELRTVLRLHYVEKLTTAELATFLGVGRATVVRRLREARTSLLDAMHAELRARIPADAEEIESLIRLLRSQLDVSVARLLRTTSTT